MEWTDLMNQIKHLLEDNTRLLSKVMSLEAENDSLRKELKEIKNNKGGK